MDAGGFLWWILISLFGARDREVKIPPITTPSSAASGASVTVVSKERERERERELSVSTTFVLLGRAYFTQPAVHSSAHRQPFFRLRFSVE